MGCPCADCALHRRQMVAVETPAEGRRVKLDRWKIATVLLLVALVYVLVLAINAKQRADAAEAVIDEYALKRLPVIGFKPGDFKPPKIPDAPPGTKPIVVVDGQTHHPPVVAPPAPNPTTPPIVERPISVVDGGGTPPPCSLDDLDITLGCKVDVLTTPTRPWARLLTSAKIEAWGQTRIIEPTPAGEVHLEVSPSVTVPKWHLDALAGVSAGERFGVEAGATWTGKSRLGPYVLIEWQPSTGGTAYDSYSDTSYSTGQGPQWRIHAGLRIRVK